MAKGKFQQVKDSDSQINWLTGEILEIKETPETHVMWNQRGNEYDSEGEWRKAIECYKKAIIIKSDYHIAWSNIGNTYYLIGEFNQAISYINHALKLQPKYFFGWFNLAAVYIAMGRITDAVKCLKKALALDSSKYYAWSYLGNTYMEIGKIKQAIRCFKKALDINPDNASTWNSLGVVFYEINKLDKAMEYYKKVVEIAPDYYQALGNISLIYDKMGNQIKAKSYFEKALKIGKHDYIWLHDLGNIYHELGNFEQAKELYLKALEIVPDYLIVHKKLELLEKEIELLKELESKKLYLKTSEHNLLSIEEELDEKRKKGISVIDLQDKVDELQIALAKHTEEILDLTSKNKKLKTEKEIFLKNKILADIESLIKTAMLKQLKLENKFELCRKIKEIDDDYLDKILDNLVNNSIFRTELYQGIKYIRTPEIKSDAMKLLEENDDKIELRMRLKTWLEKATKHVDKESVLKVFKLLLTIVLTLPTIIDHIHILYLAANPESTPILNFSEEIHAIKEELEKAELRDRFKFQLELAVRVKDLSKPIMSNTPNIVHFSGHGNLDSEMKLLDESGKKSQTVPKEALANMLELYKEKIQCVVLNVCYSEEQAKAIAKHVDCVIGVPRRIEDSAAIAFSQGFYRALGQGYDVKKATKAGINQIQIEDKTEEELPQLIALNVNPEKIVF